MTKISELIYQAKISQLEVPRFQRGWVWRKSQVLQFFESLYKKYPVGTLIVWPNNLDNRPIESVIDGQQRLTALYCLINGEPPPWLENQTDNYLKDIMFNVDTEEFKYKTQKITGDPLWVNITDIFQKGHEWWAEEYKTITNKDAQSSYHIHVARLVEICERDLYVDKLPANVPIDEAAEVFKIVNRAGTRVSEGDLVLGQLCMKWDEAKEKVNTVLKQWRDSGYTISLEWLLHSMSASIAGKINFDILTGSEPSKIVNAFDKVTNSTSQILDHLRDTLGIDATTSAAINNGLIVVVIEHIQKKSNQTRELIGWWLLSTLHNRWTADIKNRTNKDLEFVISGGIDNLLHELRITNPSLQSLNVPINGFALTRSSKPYYRLLLTLTRRRGALDLKSGLSLSFDHTSELSSLEAHHIFPRKLLSDAGFNKSEIDQLANLAFVTKGANLRIGSRSPSEYLSQLKESNPGVLESQWIPQDPNLWTVESYLHFLDKRSELLAEASNEFLQDLIGDYW